MYLFIALNLLQASAFIIGIITLSLAVIFFIASRRALKETLQKTKQLQTEPHFTSIKETIHEAYLEIKTYGRQAKHTEKSETDENTLEYLKTTVLQQQKLLNMILRHIEQNASEKDKPVQNNHLKENRIPGLQLIKTKEEAETIQQTAISTNVKDQPGIDRTEKDQAYTLYENLQKKTIKREEAFLKNQNLQQQLNVLETQLSDANRQRRQLQNRVEYLQNMNTDLQVISDANKKLRADLQRMGELESRLDIISEERDYLLKQGINK